MKSKVLFIILVCVVLGSLTFSGVTYYHKNTELFFIIEGLTIFCTFIFIVLYRKLIKPYQLLTSSMELIKEQDFSTRLRPIPNSEANKLIEIFNKMMDQLRNERLNVREKNHFLDLLIQASPQGVVMLDFDSRITNINLSGLRLLEIQQLESVVGKKLNELQNPVCQKLASLKSGDETIFRVGSIVQYRGVASSFLDRGASHPFILIEELTRELLAMEKKSYESVIRMMAHEVNNSVGAISSTLGVIAEIATQSDNEELEEVIPAVDASIERCSHLSDFVSNLAEVVKIPEPNLTQIDVNQLLESVVRIAYGECKKRNIHIKLLPSEEPFLANIDGIQFEQVFLNIVKNAYEAIEKEGDIVITVSPETKVVEIKNNGPMLTDSVLQRLFTPFYSTKSNGHGIGLMFVREVLINHRCRFDFYSHGVWTMFVVTLP
jgi:nitrogen fixation/metabolism regulation signal transduction histidine kinase